ncbi:glutamate--cysteine ligase [Chloroflexi bacterium TSY]|nr:glutamate--cysteine ligase [Chloroflexi bacterium TSY]
MFHQRLNQLSRANQIFSLSNGQIGIEKESLRVTQDGRLSQESHPVALGSALTHSVITTDFSEALLELITPPFVSIHTTLNYLQRIHQFVYRNIEVDELLWATSMPCFVTKPTDIPIAQYGTSNVGQMKHTYRRGLDVRYGRMMQAISGIHFNYSVPTSLWPIFQEVEQDSQTLRDFISARYLGLARNVMRYEWLLAYLFGASPAICKSFLQKINADFQEFDPNSYYQPYATSLRMSNIGYKNSGQINLGISYNHLDDYIADLTRAVITPYAPYEKLGIQQNGVYQQLNANLLQIENEFYSSVRPKQIMKSGEPPVHALRTRGVHYIELRVLDVNAFEPLGIGETDAHFIEAFLLFCLLQESPPIDQTEQKVIAYNQSLTARHGRDPAIRLQHHGEQRSVMEWANKVLSAMEELCSILDSDKRQREQRQSPVPHPYTNALQSQREAVYDPERTPSARMIRIMNENHESFSDFAMRMSRQHQETIRSIPFEDEDAVQFTQMANDSLEKQARLEATDTITFPEYLQKYYDQLPT